MKNGKYEKGIQATTDKSTHEICGRNKEKKEVNVWVKEGIYSSKQKVWNQNFMLDMT
jgi:hypothetical protein